MPLAANAELRPETAVKAVNAGIVLGWTAPDASQDIFISCLLAGVSSLSKSDNRAETNTTTSVNVDEGVPFLLQARKPYEILLHADQNAISVSIDGREIYSVRPPSAEAIAEANKEGWNLVGPAQPSPGATKHFADFCSVTRSIVLGDLN